MNEANGEVMIAKGKWTTLSFLCGLFVVYTIDRSLLGLLALPLQRELGFTDVQLGLLNGTIFWTYAAAVPFAGVLGDRLDRRRLIGVAAVLWSLMVFLAGFASGFWSVLMLVSVAVVLPQTFYGPSANALIASLHKETLTRAMSCHQAAFYVGWFSSGAAVAGVLALFGTWRAAFFVFGAVGMVVGALFYVVSAGRGPSPASRRQGPSLVRSFSAYFGCPSALLASVGYVVEVFVMCGYCAWAPKFVAQKFGLSASSAGTGVMFWQYAASFASILAAGALTDRIVRRHPRFRLALSASAMCLLIPALLMFSKGSSLTTVWTGTALIGVLMGVIGANQFTNLFDVVPTECRSGSLGFLNVIAGLCGGLAPVMFGGLSATGGVAGLEIGFLVCGAVQVAAVAAFGISFFFTFYKDRK